LAEIPHPEVTAKLDTRKRCIVIVVSSGSRTSTFKTTEPVASLWSDGSPCPVWAQDAVRAWSRTPMAMAQFRQLAELLGEPVEDEIDTEVDRSRKR
jgi:hypothetical protein